MKRLALSLVLCVSAALMTAAPLIAPTPAATAKSAKRCRKEAGSCKKKCDDLIDIGNSVKDCKDRCDDKEVLCFPTGNSSKSAARATGGSSSGSKDSTKHGVIASGLNAPARRSRGRTAHHISGNGIKTGAGYDRHDSGTGSRHSGGRGDNPSKPELRSTADRHSSSKKH